MRFFDNARRRRMLLTGSWSIEWGISFVGISVPSTIDAKSSDVTAGFVPRSVGTANLWVRASIGTTTSFVSGAGSGYTRFKVRLVLAAYNTTVGFDLDDVLLANGPPGSGDGYANSFSASGTYEIAVDMEEYWFHENGRFTSPSAVSRLARPFDLEGVPTRRTYITRPREGGNVLARITSGSREALDSRTITTGMQSAWGALGSPYTSGTSSTYSRPDGYTAFPATLPPSQRFPTCDGACTAALELASGAAAVVPPGFSASSSATSTASESAAHATLGLWTSTPSNPSLAPGDYEGQASFNASSKPVQRHRLTADILSGSGGYVPGIWDVQVQEAGGSGTLIETVTITGGRFDRTYSRDGRQVTITFSGGGGSGAGGSTAAVVRRLTETSGTPNPIETPAAFPSTPSLIVLPGAHGVPLLHPRMLLRGRQWLSRRLGQAASYSYGRTGAGGSWDSSRVTASANVTKSITGGVLRLVASAGFAGGKAATLDSQSQRAEFRYHNLRWRRVDSGSGTMQVRRGEMTLASHQMLWNCPADATAATWKTSARDVFAPDYSVPNVVAGSVSPDAIASPLVANWEVHLPAGAGTWEMDYLEGTRQSFSEGTSLSAPMPGIGGLLDACTDGMSLADISGPSWRTAQSIVPSGSKPWLGLGAPWLWGSWTYGDTGPDYTDMSYWYDSDLGTGYYESGDGMLLAGDGLTIPQRLDLTQRASAVADISLTPRASAGADISLIACDLLERAGVYAGFGDGLFEGAGGFGETVIFRFGTIVGPRAVGIVRGTGGGGATDVTAYGESAGVEVGRGTPGVQGFYVLAALLEKDVAVYTGHYSLRLAPEADTAQRISITVGSAAGEVKDRDMVYTLWYLASPGTGLSVDTMASGKTSYALVRAGYIITGWSLDWATSLWQEKATGVTGTQPCLRFDTSDSLGRAYLLYLDAGGAVNLTWSENEGASWSMSTTVWSSGAAHPSSDVSPSGFLLSAARLTGGAVEVKAVDRAGTILYTATALSSGAADDSTPLTWDASAQRWYLIYLDTGGSVQRLQSIDNGKTWS